MQVAVLVLLIPARKADQEARISQAASGSRVLRAQFLAHPAPAPIPAPIPHPSEFYASLTRSNILRKGEYIDAAKLFRPRNKASARYSRANVLALLRK
ncbi:MAG: hypothetical protein PEGG_01121 [Paraeggerthella hongkongensis]